MQFVSFFAMKMEQLMTSIFRYELNRVTRILRQLEFGKFQIYFLNIL